MDLQEALRWATNGSLGVLVLAAIAGHFARGEALRALSGWGVLLAVHAVLVAVLARLALAARGAEDSIGATLPLVGIAGLSVLAIGWHVVSAARSQTVQQRVSWVAASALFLCLAVLFTHLVRQAWAGEGWVLVALFGFLLAVFTSGLVVSLVKTVGSFRGGGSGGEHATH